MAMLDVTYIFHLGIASYPMDNAIRPLNNWGLSLTGTVELKVLQPATYPSLLQSLVCSVLGCNGCFADLIKMCCCSETF